MESNHSTCSDDGIGTQPGRARSMVSGWTLLGLAFFLLVSYTNSFSTQNITKQPTSAAPGNHLSTTPTPQLTQQYEFTEQDSGKMVTYTVTSRFGIILNQQKYPKNNIQVSCIPQGTLGSISNIPSVALPLYALRYEGVQPGLCTIKNENFLLTVKIVALND